MTLNGVTAVILRYFTKLGRVKHVTLVEVRHIVCDKNVAQRIY